MGSDGLGLSGSGAGMFQKLFDAGVDLGVSFGRQELGIQPGANQATRLGLTEPQLTNTSSGAGTLKVNNVAGMSQQNMLIIAVVIIGAFLLAKA